MKLFNGLTRTWNIRIPLWELEKSAIEDFGHVSAAASSQHFVTNWRKWENRQIIELSKYCHLQKFTDWADHRLQQGLWKDEILMRSFRSHSARFGGYIHRYVSSYYYILTPTCKRLRSIHVCVHGGVHIAVYIPVDVSSIVSAILFIMCGLWSHWEKWGHRWFFQFSPCSKYPMQTTAT